MNCKFTPMKRCRICGDRAISFNFNVMSCESCKSFFRRNSLKREILECALSNQKCEINMETRMLCKRCRLEKCITAGMKQSVNRRQGQKTIENVDEIKLEQIEDTEEIPVDLKESKYAINKPSHSISSQQMLILREVENAMETIYGTVDRHDVKLDEATDLIQVLNLSAFDVPKTIQFCKSLSAFNALNSEDQLTLLKSFYPAKYCVMVSHLYNIDKESWIELACERRGYYVKMEVFQQFDQADFYSMFRSFIISLHLEMEDDKTIRDLILAQQLFKPSFRIKAPEYARFYYIQYRYLFRQYLQHKYQSPSRADRKYNSLINLLDQLDNVAEAVRDMYAKVDPEKLCEILVEMFLH